MVDFKKIPWLHEVTRTTPVSSRNGGSAIDHCLVKIESNDLRLPRRSLHRTIRGCYGLRINVTIDYPRE